MDLNAHPFHAYMIEIAKASQKDYVKAVAKANLCPNGGDQCDICRRIETDNHPDVLFLEDERGVRVGDVRALISSLGSMAYEGGARVVGICNAEQMTTQAQNALLKTLEEPPSNTTILLMVEDKGALLPTIQSRSVALRPEIKDSASLDALNIPSDVKDAILAYATDLHDATHLAEEMQQQTGRWESRNIALSLVEMLVQHTDLESATALLPDDKNTMQEILSALMQCFSHAIMVSLQADVKTDAREQKILNNLKEYAPQLFASCVEIVHQCNQMLFSNVQLKLCKDWLCIHIMEVFS